MNVLTFPSNEELNEAAAGLLTATLHQKANAVLGLATGSTPIGVYEKLVEFYKKGRVSFQSATTFNLDEYVGLPRDHAESYYTFMNTRLFQHIDLPEANAHIPDGHADDPQQECERYDRMIGQAGGIDVQILGIGHNGHIGFNEPGDTLQSATHLIELHEETRKANARFFASIDEVPTKAITVGLGTIMKSKSILLLARGSDKAEIMRRALRGPIDPQCPASFLQLHPQLIVMTDSEAGRLL
ncbi:glucosamine-6-phosphate deaminase [Paenibacillus sp. J2TS4]|uniref:glucosamine-6-phosphate deaminase n=1 Tax=Paenibacillus sp. J2TS4 TaxID=2807194 RepID=UPI001B06F2E8|nr:glucosamine-6-phosphate deaminase [Paenibacillus sp. J2TS4]GIP32736.1 glucosamine-6-phosphate deaminase [Paenibacillus sp. J2TS4]